MEPRQKAKPCVCMSIFRNRKIFAEKKKKENGLGRSKSGLEQRVGYNVPACCVFVQSFVLTKQSFESSQALMPIPKYPMFR